MIKLLFVAVTLVSFVLYRAEKVHPALDERSKKIDAFSNLEQDSLVKKDAIIIPATNSTWINRPAWNSLPSIIY